MQKPLTLTLAIIKPHVIKQPHALKAIRNIITENDFKIIRSKRYRMSLKNAENFYSEHKEKFFFNRLVTFMASGPSDFYVLARRDAVDKWRELMGPTKVYQAQYLKPDSIRGSYGLSDTRNATHGSDSPESFKREISMFFPDFDVDEWYRTDEMIFRNGRTKLVENEFVHIPDR